MYQQFRPARYNMLPPVVKNLIIVNVLCFLAKYVFIHKYGYDINDMFGLHYPGSETFKPWQFITYQFMHGDFRHLISNMLGIFMFGYLLENLWGSKRFLIFYLVTGMGAAMIHYGWIWWHERPMMTAMQSFLDSPSINGFEAFRFKINYSYFAYYNGIFDPEQLNIYYLKMQQYEILKSTGVTSEATQLAITITEQYRYCFINSPSMTIVGASGSLFGVLMGVGLLYPNSPFPYFLNIKYKWIVTFYGLGELVSAYKNNPNDNVAHLAHLGGMVFGFILVKIYQRDRTRFY